MKNGIENKGDYRILSLTQGYQVQRLVRGIWNNVEHYDYLSNARQRVKVEKFGANQKDLIGQIRSQ